MALMPRSDARMRKGGAPKSHPVIVSMIVLVMCALEKLRLVMAELQVADVRAQVTLSLFTDFENFTIFKPAEYLEQAVNTLMDQVIA